MRLSALVFVATIISAAWASPQTTNSTFIPYDVQHYGQALFQPFETLSALSTLEYTTMGHPEFPRHQVRMKKTFFEKGVKGYTGYIDIGARHIFFYFFESRNDPAKDDIIFWTNGGPGCSSAVGLFLGIGPCRILEDGGLESNPHSWNNHANVLFVDQPIGVGFSYAEYGEAVGTTGEGAKDIAAFLVIFLENFREFKGRPLHMAGESYAGRYIPLFAAEIYDQNSRLLKTGIHPINLTSAIIGNGLTNPWATMSSYYDMQCTHTSVAPVLDISSCVRMKRILPRCENLTKKSCIDTFDAINCNAAFNFCFLELFEPYLTTGLNPNDMSKTCEPGTEESLCYPILQQIGQLLNQPKWRERLGVDPSFTSNFSSCSVAVEHAFAANLDAQHTSTLHLAALLERGVKVLSYVGDYDFICNWVGNERWTLELDWSGREDFSKQPLRDWAVDGQIVGKTRSANGLTYATVHAAGHMVPYDKPKEAWALISRWIKGESL